MEYIPYYIDVKPANAASSLYMEDVFMWRGQPATFLVWWDKDGNTHLCDHVTPKGALGSSWVVGYNPLEALATAKDLVREEGFLFSDYNPKSLPIGPPKGRMKRIARLFGQFLVRWSSK